MKMLTVMLTLILAVTASIALPVCAQKADPFARKSVPDDPFGRQAPPAGMPIEFLISVVDHQNAPVPSAWISVRSFDPQNMASSVDAMPLSLRTNKQGLATWRTTDQQLVKLAGLNQGSVLFAISPPEELLIPRIHKTYKLDALKPGTKLRFVGREGIRIEGTVKGQQDQQPVAQAYVYITKKDTAVPTSTKFITATNEEGKWSIVVPRVDSLQVVCRGSVDGYHLGSGEECRKVVDIAPDAGLVSIPPFEVKQLLPVEGRILDESGRPVRNATVSANYPRWYAEEYVQFESLASEIHSNTEGQYSLELHRANWKEGFVTANAVVDGVAHGGRVKITEPVNGPTDIRLHPLSRISGTVTRGGKPVGGVGLVIYETFNVPGKPERWVEVGFKGQGTTTESGAFEFFVEGGVNYAIASKDQEDRLTTQYRTASELAAGGVLANFELQPAAKVDDATGKEL
ncbi:MAG: hypothetical protein ACPGLY_25105 [Rubripirellula sp.]